MFNLREIYVLNGHSRKKKAKKIRTVLFACHDEHQIHIPWAIMPRSRSQESENCRYRYYFSMLCHCKCSMRKQLVYR